MQNQKMPVLFAGHGSPMNAVEDNAYSRGWAEIARKIPEPKAILSISAHWYTEGTWICNAERPRTVYDFYGFPEELYQVQYAPPGAPALAQDVAQRLGGHVKVDNTWGIDHGTWSVLCKMYPQANIPVCQLSVDSGASAQAHYQMGQALAPLREQGVLIFGSGNVVHNLAKVNWAMEGQGYPWAVSFDADIKEKIRTGRFDQVVAYASAGEAAALSVPTPEHFLPLLYILGASRPEDRLQVFNDSCTLGALSMTGYLFA